MAEIIDDVRIGKNRYIGWGAILRGDYGTIIIGDKTAIEEGIIIHNATIKDYATIGMRATISDFSEVGEWSLVAEQALITRKQIILPR